MKKVFLSLAGLFFLIVCVHAQNSSPFWSLAGNSNAGNSAKLGSTNSVDLKLITNNTERMRITVDGSVGIGTTPGASAKLDINSTKRGLLIPRMSQTQRNAISSPATGLLIFQTDNAPGFYYFTGSSWSSLKGANTSLSNLSEPTSINQALLPAVSSNPDLGSFSRPWFNVFATNGYYLAGSKVIDVSGSVNTFLGITGNVTNTGGFNTFIGAGAGHSNTSGGANEALGVSALVDNQTGSENLALGRASLLENIGGSFNTAVGNLALLSNKNNIQNTAVGYGALANTTSSDNNTAIGFQAGISFDNGFNNCFLGSQTGTNAGGYFNVVTIGHGAVATASSQVTIGNSATNSYRAYNNWSNISDGRYKKNIKENVPGLAFINKLKAVTYNLDAKGLDNFLNKNSANKSKPGVSAKTLMDKALADKEKSLQSGFVAQDVEKAAKEIGYDFSGVDAAKDQNDVYGLRYAEFVVPLVKAVQELSAKNDEKDQKIASLEAKLDKLEGMTKSTSSATTILNNVTLDQNKPNPFGTTTTIGYDLPSTYTSAKIYIADVAGKMLKTMNISGSGKGTINVDAGTLSAGTYYYSLYVDNKLVSSKSMIKGK